MLEQRQFTRPSERQRQPGTSGSSTLAACRSSSPGCSVRCDTTARLSLRCPTQSPRLSPIATVPQSFQAFRASSQFSHRQSSVIRQLASLQPVFLLRQIPSIITFLLIRDLVTARGPAVVFVTVSGLAFAACRLSQSLRRVRFLPIHAALHPVQTRTGQLDALRLSPAACQENLLFRKSPSRRRHARSPGSGSPPCFAAQHRHRRDGAAVS